MLSYAQRIHNLILLGLDAAADDETIRPEDVTVDGDHININTGVGVLAMPCVESTFMDDRRRQAAEGKAET